MHMYLYWKTVIDAVSWGKVDCVRARLSGIKTISQLFLFGCCFVIMKAVQEYQGPYISGMKSPNPACQTQGKLQCSFIQQAFPTSPGHIFIETQQRVVEIVGFNPVTESAEPHVLG